MSSARWRNGSTRAWRTLRERRIALDGHRCTALLESGERCPSTVDLEAHHLDDGDELVVPIDRLRTRCRPCHESTFAAVPA
jgi:hypothetical protein